MNIKENKFREKVKWKFMKKTACCILAAGMAVMSAAPANVFMSINTCVEVQAAEETEELTYKVGNSTYTYAIKDDNTVEITDYSGTDTEIVIPGEIDGKKVTSIGVIAFSGCRGLTSITIPEGVTSIGNKAFSDCCSLTSITILEGVTSIGWRAFWNCSSLTSISVAAGNEVYKSIEGVLFSKDGKKLIVYPSNKEGIEYVIPEGVTSIEEYAFIDCSGLTSIIIPKGVTDIGDAVFCRCSSLTSITIPEGVTSIGESAFSDCSSLTSITIPEGVTSIGEYAFSDCSSLTSITIPEGVTRINSETFWWCSGLTSITIPESVTSIGMLAFADCSSLTSITIPEGVTSIGGSAFSNCSSLTSITIPEGVTVIGGEPFCGCSSLTSISVAAGNEKYKSTEGVLFSKDGKELIAYPSNKEETKYMVPEGVTGIGSWAFYECSSLTSITISEGITRIGWSSFRGCSALTTIAYSGSEQDWENISIDPDNDSLTNATIYYNTKYLPDTLHANTNQSTYKLFVKDNLGQAIEGAIVTCRYGGMEVTNTTGKDGYVDFADISGEPQFIVSKSGYLTYDTNEADLYIQPGDVTTIRLLPSTCSALELKKAAFINTTNGAALGHPYDLLTSFKTVSLTNADSHFKLTCKAVYPQDVKKYSILQDNAVLYESTDGNFENLKVGSFKADVPVYVRVEGNDGKSEDTQINLTVAKAVTAVEDTVLDISDEISIKVADNIPFLGGSQISVDIAPLPVEVYCAELDDGSSQIHIGINTKIKKDGNDPTEELQKIKKVFQKAGKKPINKKLAGELEELMDGAEKKSPFSLNFIGYGSGKLKPDGSADIGVQLYLVWNYKKTLTSNTIFIPIPVTYNVKFNAEVKTGVGAVIDFAELQKGNVMDALLGDFVWDVNGKAGLEAFGGVGVGKLAAVGAYGEGELSMALTLIDNTGKKQCGINSVDLTGQLGIKAYLGPWEYKKNFAYNTWNLYTQKNKTKMIFSSFYGAQLENDSMYDTGNYQMSDLSGLEQESDWLGGNSEIICYDMSSGLTDSDLLPLQKNTYFNTQPVIGNADGTPVMVWGKANTARKDADARQLVYSVYSNGIWSEPKPVNPNCDTFDSAHAVVTSQDGTMYLVYQSTDSLISDAQKFSEYASKQSIVAAQFDKTKGEFTNFTTLSKAGMYSRTPVITADGNKIIAAWIDNSDFTDLFGQNATNNIMYAVCENGVWSNAGNAAASVNAVKNIAVGKINDTVTIAANISNDNNMNTNNSKLVTYAYPFNGENVVNEDIGQLYQICFAKLPDRAQSTLVYGGSDALYSYDGTKTAPVANLGSVPAGFNILPDRIIFSAAENDGANLFEVLYDGKWSNPVRITNQEQYIQSYQAACVNGEIFIAAVQNTVTLSEADIKENCTLSWMKSGDVADLTVDSVEVDQTAASLGEKFKATVYIENAGSKAMDTYTVVVSANGKQIDTITGNTIIKAGDSAKLEMMLPAYEGTKPETEYTFTVSCKEEQNTANNTLSEKVGLANLSLDTKVVRVGNKNTIIAKITNNGVIASSGNLTVKWDDGETYMLSVPELAAGEESIADIDCSRAGQSENGSNTVIVTLDTAVEDVDIYDNQATEYLSAAATADNPILFADANSDGKVNSKDVVMMKKHLAGIQVDINLAACDVNADGKFDSKDVVKTMKKLAGYDVVLGEK